MNLSKQNGFTNIAIFFGVGFLVATAAFIFFLSQKKPAEPISLMPSIAPSPLPSIVSFPSPSPSFSAIPIIETPVIKEQIKISEQDLSSQSEIFIEKIVYEKENGKPKITLEGRKFGEKKNQILFDNNVHNYGYTIISWNDNHIEFYGSEWIPKDKNVTVAIIGNSGDKSNTVSFFNPK